jgi:hypothetical protein
MAHIFIEYVSDYWDCETCGGSSADGATVEIDGKPFGDFYPAAHCYDSLTYSNDDIYCSLLEHLGITVKKDDHGYLNEDFNLSDTLEANGHTLDEGFITISNYDYMDDDDDWDNLYEEGLDPEEHEEWVENV